MFTAEDFISGDWIVDLGYPDIPLQVLYPMEDGIKLKHSFRFSHNYGEFYRLSIPSKIEYSRIGLITVDRSILEGIGFKCDDQYAFYNLDDNNYLYYYFYEYRLEKIYRGVDEWSNGSEVRDVSFMATVRTVDQLHHAFKMANVNVEIKL